MPRVLRWAKQAGQTWATHTAARLAAMPNVRMMTRTTVMGAFDHGVYGAVERVSDHLPVPQEGKPRQILWRVYSRRAILAAGATERPIVFENNDRPGIMLAGAMRAYANRWAATPAQEIAVFTNNDDGHRTASDLAAKGVTVAAVIDTRPDAPEGNGYEVIAGGTITNTSGRLGLTQIEVRDARGNRRRIACGALGVSGGWNPNVSLTCHQRGRPAWNADIHAFVPGGTLPAGMVVAGAADGACSRPMPRSLRGQRPPPTSPPIWGAKPPRPTCHRPRMRRLPSPRSGMSRGPNAPGSISRTT